MIPKLARVNYCILAIQPSGAIIFRKRIKKGGEQPAASLILTGAISKPSHVRLLHAQVDLPDRNQP